MHTARPRGVRYGTVVIVAAAAVLGFASSAMAQVYTFTNGTINASGNVGIGTTAPTEPLDVNSVLRVSGTGGTNAYGVITLGNHDNGSGYLGDNGIYRGGIGSLSAGNYLNLASYQGIAFDASNNAFGSQTTRMYIDGSTGNIGVGISTPQVALQVNGAVGATNLAGANLVPYASDMAYYNASTAQLAFVDGRTVTALKSAQDGTGNCYQWGSTGKFPVNPGADYEYSLWVQANGIQNVYMGFFVYDASGNQLTSGSLGNPYFHTGAVQTGGGWEQLVGYLRASGTPANSSFTAVTNSQKSANSNSIDWVMPSNAAYAMMRWGSCYGGTGTTGIAYMYLPSVQEVSETQNYEAISVDQNGANFNYGFNKTNPAYVMDVNGAANFNGNVVHNVGTPVVSTDAANKSYVDTAIANGSSGSSPTFTNVEITAGNGNGICFWTDCTNYKISMGNSSEYLYGPVNDYSIKESMNSGSPGRGWTWGVQGQTPVMALNEGGTLQVAGTITAGGFSGPLSAANVSAGTFGGNTGGGAYTFTGGPYTNDWFRVNGSGGIYWQNYGGGWYMSDSTWLRTYNNASVYAGTGTIRTDGSLQVGAAGATFNAPSGSTVTVGYGLGVTGNETVSGSLTPGSLCLSGTCKSSWPSGSNFTWNWSGQGGQPPWVWGGSDGTNMYVYNPSNFSVNYANTAGSANSANSLSNMNVSQFNNDAGYLKTSNFSSGLGAIGYDQLPDGLIIQWGNCPINGNTYCGFYKSFPNAVLNVTAGTYGSADRITFVTSWSTSGVYINNNGSSVNASWIAIGY